MQRLAKPVRDGDYLEWVRLRPCALCHEPPRSEAHHVVPRGGGRMGKKTDDDRTVPLCLQCHASVHAGKVEHEVLLGALVETLIASRRAHGGDW